MKRISYNVALGAALAMINGNTRIVVENRKNPYLYFDNHGDEERWEGLAIDLYDAPDIVRYKWMRTKVHEIRHYPDYIMFIISTESDLY